MNELQDRHVLITGASGALGTAVTERVLELGARATLVDLNAPAQRQDGQSLALDLLDLPAVYTALSRFDRIDALIHLAGGFMFGPPLHELGPEPLQRMMAINVTTLHNVVQAVVPTMKNARSGSIVTVGANSAMHGQANMSAYCAAKSVVMRMTESMAAELREFGIRTNCVLPSIINTPQNRTDMPDADFSQWVQPRELADVICFLASSASSGINGALIPVVGRV